MLLRLSTTIRKIQNIPNSKNIEIINEFLDYMRSNYINKDKSSTRYILKN
jgi:hypothetical protein